MRCYKHKISTKTPATFFATKHKSRREENKVGCDELSELLMLTATNAIVKHSFFVSRILTV